MIARSALLGEIVAMALDTLRSNKMRSVLTILGVVIGVTSIVGMTSLIRGFGSQLESLIQQMGASTVYVSKMSISSFASGKSFFEVLKRPDITPEDARAIRDGVTSAGVVSVQVGDGPAAQVVRMTYAGQSTKGMPVIGTDARWPETNFINVVQGRFFGDFEVEKRRQVVVLGAAPAAELFASVDPIGKKVRLGKNEFTVVGVLGKRPSPLGGTAQDEFAVMPLPTYEKIFEPPRFRGLLMQLRIIGVVAREGATREQVIAEVEQVMRSRHRLALDAENDFDILTSDTVQGILDQFTRAIVLALVVISSIALMVGGIGVMAIMTISVTERTREIGVRKAIGARAREILWQFLIEAVVLTSLGGILGILLGSAIGLGVNVAAGFPVSLPWWSFVLGLGFSASVGIFFGLWPAFRAAKLDPIEALRYE